MRWVGQYIFKMPQGLFLLDTLTSTDDVQKITAPQMRDAGLNLSSIFAAMPTHGHWDHYGGAAYLQGTYHIPVYLGSADAAGKPFVVTQLNTADLDPHPMNFGGLNAVLLSTPGHTPGTFSGILPVSFRGKPYKVAFWGGTALPSTLDAAKQYLNGTERLWALAEQQNIAGTIHTHPFVDGSLNYIDEINAAGGYDKLTSNPFLIGHANAMRSLAVLRECAAAKVAQLDPAAAIAEWRVTSMDVASTWDARKHGNSISASVRVKSPYGPVTGGTVEFKFAPGGEACSATPDVSGIATCSVAAKADAPSTVTAHFDGTASSTVRNLPSQQTATIERLN
jgi:metallo-beta-lactamase class B